MEHPTEEIRKKVKQIAEQDADTVNRYIAQYLHRTGADIRNVKLVINRVMTEAGWKHEYYLEPLNDKRSYDTG